MPVLGDRLPRRPLKPAPIASIRARERIARKRTNERSAAATRTRKNARKTRSPLWFESGPRTRVSFAIRARSRRADSQTTSAAGIVRPRRIPGPAIKCAASAVVVRAGTPAIPRGPARLLRNGTVIAYSLRIRAFRVHILYLFRVV